MTYRREIGFPINPTKADIKELKRQVAKDRFRVIGGPAIDNRVDDRSPKEKEKDKFKVVGGRGWADGGKSS